MEKPIAFVVMSFAPEHRGVYEYVIKRTFEKDLGWVCWRVDERPGAGNLVRQIVEGIARATLVVADLTALEPQVLYELGVAHTLGVPVLTLYQPGSEDKMPFQLRSYRSIEYENTAAGAAELCEALSEAVATLPEWGAQPSNPVQDFLPVERRGGPTISTVPLPATPADEAPLRELAYARERASMVRRRLHLLQVQQARQGSTIDPSVLIEIEDLSEQLEALRREIARLEGGR